MNMNIMSHKKTILILVLIIGVFFAYWFLFLSKKDAQQSLGQGSNTNVKAQGANTSQYDKDFVSSLLGLSSVNLDISILQSKVYQALNYPTTPFVVNYSMESGRNNPFLPIGFEGNSVIQQAPTQQTVPAANVNTSSTTTQTPPATTNPEPTVKPTPKKF